MSHTDGDVPGSWFSHTIGFAQEFEVAAGAGFDDVDKLDEGDALGDDVDKLDEGDTLGEADAFGEGDALGEDDRTVGRAVLADVAPGVPSKASEATRNTAVGVATHLNRCPTPRKSLRAIEALRGVPR
jgi:hypothetical protein